MRLRDALLHERRVAQHLLQLGHGVGHALVRVRVRVRGRVRALTLTPNP